MKYTVRVVQDWNCPYSYSDGDDTICRSVEDRSWTCPTKDLATKVLREFTDAPYSEMTMEQAREDFDDETYPVPEANLEGVVRYFNGRLRLFGEIMADIDAAKAGWKKRYDIPYELNHLEVRCGEPPAGESQNSAYIEVSAEND